jgi:CRISPR/Cas system type I-B associated protein Csh2 (Cas7 group RAMP superfamily)
MASNLKQNGMSNQEIAKYTGLPLEDIEKI